MAKYLDFFLQLFNSKKTVTESKTSVTGFKKML